jgi:hypothetical protein
MIVSSLTFKFKFDTNVHFNDCLQANQASAQKFHAHALQVGLPKRHLRKRMPSDGEHAEMRLLAFDAFKTRSFYNMKPATNLPRLTWRKSLAMRAKVERGRSRCHPWFLDSIANSHLSGSRLWSFGTRSSFAPKRRGSFAREIVGVSNPRRRGFGAGAVQKSAEHGPSGSAYARPPFRPVVPN